MHSELSEMLEAFRSGNLKCLKKYFCSVQKVEKTIGIIDGKASGGTRTITSIEEEVADLFIRLCDFCGRYEIDLGRVTLAKMEYNAQRSHKHGGKLV